MASIISELIHDHGSSASSASSIMPYSHLRRALSFNDAVDSSGCGGDFESPDLDPDEFGHSKDDIDLATGLGGLPASCLGDILKTYSFSDQNRQDIFNAMVQLLRSQQLKLKTMTADRKVFEDRVRAQEEKWVFAFHLLGDPNPPDKGGFGID